MDKQTFDTGNATIGLRFSHAMPTNQGVFSPNIGLKLISDFETDSQEITGRFVANTAKSNEFKFLTTERDAQYAVIDFGFSFQLKQGNSGFLNIESLQGYEDLEQTRLNFGWRWEI